MQAREASRRLKQFRMAGLTKTTRAMKLKTTATSATDVCKNVRKIIASTVSIGWLVMAGVGYFSFDLSSCASPLAPPLQSYLIAMQITKRRKYFFYSLVHERPERLFYVLFLK